jgi:hypothetical protein
VKAISDTLGVARSNLAMQAASGRPRKRRGRRPQPEAALVTEIKTLIAGQPTYGYRRIHALLRCQRREQGGAPVNVKRVYRIMTEYGLLLDPIPVTVRNAGTMAGSQSTSPIRGGARTGSRSGATTARKCASPSPCPKPRRRWRAATALMRAPPWTTPKNNYSRSGYSGATTSGNT